MICQIRMVNLPTCRIAIRMKTAASMTTAIYVDQGYVCRVIGVGMAGSIAIKKILNRSLWAVADSPFIRIGNLKYFPAEFPS
jgi:hypothetical protein